jgi:hypothetical protein
MAVLLSPGVTWEELDFTSYAAQLATSIFGVVGQASKGKLNEPITVISATDMVKKLGNPSEDYADSALYALDQYFKKGKSALFVRITDGTEATSVSVYIQDSGAIENLFRVKAISPGTWGDDLAFTVVNIDATLLEFDFVIYEKDSTGTYVEVERYEAMSLNPDEARNFEAGINEGTDAIPVSQYVEIEMDAGFVWNSQVPAEHTTAVVLAGGDNGGTPAASDYAGTLANKRGVYAFQDADSYDVNMIAVPGMSHNYVVAEAMRNVCEDIRRDCVGIIDPPYAMNTPETVKTWRQDTGAGIGSLDSSYTFLYWPWIKINDAYNGGKKIWIPPSGIVAQAVAYSDNLTNPWIAFAGLNRGKLPGVLDIQYVTSQNERDLLQDRKVNINPIKKEMGTGFVLWGNRTNQSKPTALDQIHVRRMLLYLEKVIATSVKYLVFDPNDPVMWMTFENMVIPIFEQVKANRGVSDYKVIMDETTNTPDVVQRKEAIGLMKLIPINAAEKFILRFALYPTGASFEE